MAEAVHARGHHPLLATPVPDGTPILADFAGEAPLAQWLEAVVPKTLKDPLSNGMMFERDPRLPEQARIQHRISFTPRWEQCLNNLVEGEPYGKTIATIFELLAEEHLIQPTIIYDFPLAVSPLSKVKPDEPEWVERFEFYIGGFEVGNAFSELNDPVDQRRRFEAQVAEKSPRRRRSHGRWIEDYIRALGYGLPPTAGEGIGIDRLTMILTGSRSIRDVILFPLLRPQAKPLPRIQDSTE